MFGNKILLLNFVKLTKNKIKHQGLASFSLYNSKSDHSSHHKISDSTFVKINGFESRNLLCRNSVEIKKINKHLSYVSEEKCWKCKENRKPKRIDCPSCGALQYPKDNINFFELLGISQIYDLDLDDLSKKFKKMQKILHPDKYANKSREELEISESYSRLLNTAYTTLKNPLTRGFYMLELMKIETSANFELEPNFLMFIMEKNEELECRNSLSSLSLFLKENSLEMEKEMKKISEAFRFNDTNQAKSSLVKLNYFMNLDKKIQEKHRKLSIPENSD